MAGFHKTWFRRAVIGFVALGLVAGSCRPSGVPSSGQLTQDAILTSVVGSIQTQMAFQTDAPGQPTRTPDEDLVRTAISSLVPADNPFLPTLYFVLSATPPPFVPRPTQTDTPFPTRTNTPIPSRTPRPTATDIEEPTETPTGTPSPTEEPETDTPQPTGLISPTLTLTPTATLTVTVTATSMPALSEPGS
jgi:hypothetical protein